MFDSPTFTRMFAPTTSSSYDDNHNNNRFFSTNINFNNNEPFLSSTQKFADLLSWQIVHTAEIEQQSQRRTMTPDYKPTSSAPPLSCIVHRSFSENNLYDSFDEKENNNNNNSNINSTLNKHKPHYETILSNELNRRHSAIADLAIEPCSLSSLSDNQYPLDQIIAAPPPGFEDEIDSKYYSHVPSAKISSPFYLGGDGNNFSQAHRNNVPWNESSASSAASLLTGGVEDMSELSTGSLQLTSITQMSASELFATSTNRTFSSDTTGGLTDSFKNYQSGSGALQQQPPSQTILAQQTALLAQNNRTKGTLSYTLDFDDDIYDEDFGDVDMKINQDTSTGPSSIDFDVDLPSPPAQISTKPIINNRFGVCSKFKRNKELSREALFSSSSSSSSSSELSPIQIVLSVNARRHKTSKSLPENLYKTTLDENKQMNPVKEGELAHSDKVTLERDNVQTIDQYYNRNGRLARTKSSTIRRKKKGIWENAREWNNSASFSQTKQCFCEFEASPNDPSGERAKCSFCEPNNFGDALTPCDMNMFSYSEPSTSALDLSTANTVIERKSFDETEENDNDKMTMISNKEDDVDDDTFDFKKRDQIDENDAGDEDDEDITPKNLQTNLKNKNIHLDSFGQPIFSPSEMQTNSDADPTPESDFPSPPPPLKMFTNQSPVQHLSTPDNISSSKGFTHNLASYNSPSSSFSSSLRSTDPYTKKEHCTTWSKREDIPLLQSVDESCTMTFENVITKDEHNIFDKKLQSNNFTKFSNKKVEEKKNLELDLQEFSHSDEDNVSKSSGSHSLDCDLNHAEKDKSSTPDIECDLELDDDEENIFEHDDSTTSGSFLLDESGASATLESFVPFDKEENQRILSHSDKKNIQEMIQDRLDKEKLNEAMNKQTEIEIIDSDQQTIKRRKPLQLKIGNEIQNINPEIHQTDGQFNENEKLKFIQENSNKKPEIPKMSSFQKTSKIYERYRSFEIQQQKDTIIDNEDLNMDINFRNNNIHDAYEQCSQATDRDLEQSEFSLIHQNSELDDDESLAFDHCLPAVQNNNNINNLNANDYFSFSPIDQQKNLQEYSGIQAQNSGQYNIKTPDLFTALKYSSDEAREAGFLTLPSQSPFVINSSTSSTNNNNNNININTRSKIKESVLDRFDSKDFSSERDLSLEAVLQEESHALKKHHQNAVNNKILQNSRILSISGPFRALTTEATALTVDTSKSQELSNKQFCQQQIIPEKMTFTDQQERNLHSAYAEYSPTVQQQHDRNVKQASNNMTGMTMAMLPNFGRINNNNIENNNNMMKTNFNPDVASSKSQFVTQQQQQNITQGQSNTANADITEVSIPVPIQKGKSTKKLEFNQKLADVERLLINKTTSVVDDSNNKNNNNNNSNKPTMSTVTTLIGSTSAVSSNNNVKESKINETNIADLKNHRKKQLADCRDCKSFSTSGSNSSSSRGSKNEDDGSRGRCCGNADWSNSYSLSTTNSRGLEGSTYSTATCTMTNLSGEPSHHHHHYSHHQGDNIDNSAHFHTGGNGKREYYHDNSYQSRLELTSPACLYTNKRHIEHLKQMQGDNTSEDASEPNSQDTYDKCQSKCCQGKHHYQCNDCGQIAALSQGQYKQHKCKETAENAKNSVAKKNVSNALKAQTLLFRKKDCPESIFKKSSTIEDVYFDVDHDENDVGVHAENYRDYLWIHIGNKDEMNVWKKRQNTVTLPRKTHERISKNILDDNLSDNTTKHCDNETSNLKKLSDFDESEESTVSERDFRSNYENVTHRLIHRKASIELYRRLLDKSFVIDKRLTLHRDNNEYGFRIHGSRPVVVSAIEKQTSAEYKGLSVGDILVTVNGINVLDASHSEVVKLAARTSSKTLVLEVTSTAQLFGQNESKTTGTGSGSRIVSTGNSNKNEPKIIINGYLKRFVENLADSYGNNTDKMTNSALWRRRWFVLKSDACLYWYKTPKCIEPIGAISLQGYCASMINECLFGQKHLFRLVGFGNRPVKYFAAIDHETALQWVKALASNSIRFNNSDHFLEQSLSLIHCKPIAFPIPVDCHGFLWKLNSNNKSWKKRFFVLKDACLYFYADMHSNTALGLFFLHGYKFNTFGHNFTSTTIPTPKEQIRHIFELMPPNNKYRRIVLATHSDCEKKRWLAALEYSIDRWIQLSN